MHQKDMPFRVTFIALTLLSSALTQSDRWYVRSVGSSPQSCFHPQCLTLDDYAQQAATYFTTGSTFLFMAGNHSTSITINLADISDITFKGDNSSNAYILCKNDVTFRSNNVTNWLIENLLFTLFPSNRFREPSVLDIINCRDVRMYQLTFKGNGQLSEDTARAVMITNSSLTATSCLFEGNTGNDGGAIYAMSGSIITLNGNVFYGNKATFKGGAIFAIDSVVVINGIPSDNFTDTGNDDDQLNLLLEGVTTETTRTLIPMGIAYFCNNVAKSYGGALSMFNSNLTVNGTIVVFRNNSAVNGGAIYFDSRYSHMISSPHHLYFIDNRAKLMGGAICTEGLGGSRLLLGTGMENTNSFLKNSAQEGGGIYSKTWSKFLPEIVLMGKIFFTSNSASSKGGAIYLEHGILTLVSNNALFSSNRAETGGALFLLVSVNTIEGGDIKFEDNSAEDGGAVYSVESGLITSAAMLNFIGNSALKRGGGLFVSTYNDKNRSVVISANFTNNTAIGCGGAGYVKSVRHIYFNNVTATGNAKSALCILESRVTFRGTSFIKNAGRLGGGIQVVSRDSFLSFWDTVFDSNSAFIGGAIYSPYETSMEFSGNTLFTHNRADTDGGALYALSTKISFNFNMHYNMHNIINFSNNSAQNGGAIFLSGVAFIRFAERLIFLTSQNRASKYGGAIYYEDTAIPTQCSFGFRDDAEITELPYCFMRFRVDTIDNFRRIGGHVESRNDFAGIDGSFVYGGLLDRCQLELFTSGNNPASTVAYGILLRYFEVHKSNDATRGITSKPYQLCFCEADEIYNCSLTRNIQIYKGQKFNLFLLALDQIRNSTETQITAKISQTARLKVNQSSQTLEHHCSEVSYNLYSTKDYEQLVLYPDGPCRDTGLARAVVNVAFLACPDGLDKRNEQCVCEERLKKYETDCSIDESVVISRKAGSKFWMSGLYENHTYLGLILYKTCPSPYCKTDSLTLSINNSDIQCAYNRSGVLCGACAANYSLMLGSSQCEECSNAYLALLLPFAAAGIALVVFLSTLRLTVATGMINSIILYANIIQVNKRLFLHSEEMNVLTVFIAWLNLDLGFKSCFYDGMDAYAQTWLQFAFPLYVWILISLIVLLSRYSIAVSKLIGHNPIAVLATLLLMSYTKVLNVVIDAYSFANLDYPQNKTNSVWLKDANIPYLQSWHLLLTVVTSLVLVFLFLPYTLLLLLGYKLYRFSGKNNFRWLNRLKPLLESYYAPYNEHTRYWTGFLLLVRCALYIVFSFNSLGATSKSLLAINIAFTAIVIISWLSCTIYKKLLVNVVEASIYLNLIILSAATSNGVNSAALVHSLVGVVFVTTICIIVYHFHITYTAKSAILMKATTKLSDFQKKLIGSRNTTPPDEVSTNSASHGSHNIVTKTVIELREPLLEK